MGTPFKEVYNAFLGRIEQDEWSLTTDLGNLERDWYELMKNEWLKRCLATWRVIQQQYHTKDFEFLSQANHMSKLIDLVELSNKEVLNMTNVYSRMQNHQPFNWSQLAGGRTNG